MWNLRETNFLASFSNFVTFFLVSFFLYSFYSCFFLSSSFSAFATLVSFTLVSTVIYTFLDILLCFIFSVFQSISGLWQASYGIPFHFYFSINLYSLPMLFVKSIYFHCMFYWSSLLNIPSTFLTYIDLSILFNLNSYFLANSELITKPIVPLSNNASTVTSSCGSILSSPIFTITSLSMFLFKLQ